MQVYFVYKGVRGYHRLMERLDYVNQPQRAEIERRLKIINFFGEHKAKATEDAFGVSRSTVYLWKKQLRDGGGKLVALAPRSRAPRRRISRSVSHEIIRFIEWYRTEHPGVGKQTIKPALDQFCQRKGLRSVSESTIGREIGRAHV